MRSTYVKLIATVFFWGSNFEISKIALQSFSPLMAALLRFVTGTLFLLGYYMYKNGLSIPTLSKADWMWICLAGVFGVFLYNYFFFGGVAHLSTARGSLLIASATVFTVILGVIFFNEKLTKNKYLGIALATVGMSLVILRGDLSRIGTEAWGFGESFIILSALSWSIYTVLGKVIIKRIEILTISTFAALIGTGFLLIYCLAFENFDQLFTASGLSYLAIVYIGITATGLGYIWFYDAVKKLGAGNAAIWGTLTPVFAVLVAVLLGEKINLITAGGGLIVLAGIWLCNKQ